VESNEILALITKAVEEHKGLDLEILDVSEITIVADYFVIVSGRSKLHVEAITKAILDEIELNGLTIKSKEGNSEGGWILVDLADVIIHVFSEEKRQYYSLDKLWQDAQKVET